MVFILMFFTSRKLLLLMYHRTNVLCCKKKKEVRRKRNTQLKGKGRKYDSRFYSAMIAVIWKVHFLLRLSIPFLRGWQSVCVRAGCLTRACHSRLGSTVRAFEPLTRLFFKAAFNSPKISLLFFLYRDFGERIKCSIVTCEAVTKYVIIYLWLF